MFILIIFVFAILFLSLLIVWLSLRNVNKKYDVSQISFEYDGPIILVCGCLKYQKSLELAIKRFQYPSCLTIGIIGDPILQDCELRENILYQ